MSIRRVGYPCALLLLLAISGCLDTLHESPCLGWPDLSEIKNDDSSDSGEDTSEEAPGLPILLTLRAVEEGNVTEKIPFVLEVEAIEGTYIGPQITSSGTNGASICTRDVLDDELRPGEPQIVDGSVTVEQSGITEFFVVVNVANAEAKGGLYFWAIVDDDGSVTFTTTPPSG